ncbi:MAG: hypothetical protein K5695_04995 [Oscillospiraceae bacterium]|nr:hypothetical protein [Oscillospiraceae bacterium]
MPEQFPGLSPEEQHERFKRHLISEIRKGALYLGLGLTGASAVVVVMYLLPDYLAVLLEQAAYAAGGAILLVTGAAAMRHLLPVLWWVIADLAHKDSDGKQ